MVEKCYFFIDESGDPNFYAHRKRPLWLESTFEPVLMLGMVVVRNRKLLREQVVSFQKSVLNDPLFIIKKSSAFSFSLKTYEFRL